jgi:integrase
MTTHRRRGRANTGQTAGGNARYTKIERIGSVTIYQRGTRYSVYYRENGRSVRWPVDGNLAVARATASKINGQLEEGQRSMFAFQKMTPARFADEYLRFARDVQGLAWRSVERYRAALQRLVDFAEAGKPFATIDQVDEAVVQDFVRWLRGERRARNGSAGGTRTHYRASGIRFILSACRTAFNWARKRRHVPPYYENPFASFSIHNLRDRDESERRALMLSPDELAAFWEACDAWQRPIFEVLVAYGLRAGELTHLLIEDVDFEGGLLHIRSKPELAWYVKTERHRTLPMLSGAEAHLRHQIGSRGAGFVFVDRGFAVKSEEVPRRVSSAAGFRTACERHQQVLRDDGTEDAKGLARGMESFARTWGKISEKRLRQEFIAVTTSIGRPDITRVHSLRHLFSTRAQEAGVNPLVVQQMLGHTTLEMTGRYTHLSIDAQRRALELIGVPPHG